MQKRDLKPCPFCGAEMIKNVADGYHNWHCYYTHPDNDCIIFSVFNGLATSKDFKDWNKRKQNQDED